MPPCRPAMCSTRAIICSTRPTPRFRCACPGRRDASCGAGCSAPRPAARAPAACGAASAISSRPTRRRRRRWSRRWSPPAFCRPMAGTSASPRASRCPASRRFWRWSGVRCWRAPRPATRAIGIEAEARPPIEGLIESADAARRRSRPAVGGAAPPRRLPAAPARRPGEPARCGGCGSGSTRSCAASNAAPIVQLGGWSALLRDLGEPPRPETVEWLAIERFEGAETDIAVNRNWIDPGIPFAAGGRETGARSAWSPRRR